MIDIKSKRCIEENCNKIPAFNYKDEKTGIYCSTHKKENMIDVKHKKCINCKFNRVYHEKLCFDCFSFKFPEHKKIKKFKQKETFLVNKLKQDYPNIFTLFNRQVKCNEKISFKNRPDILGDFYDYVLVIEIDENQHQGYSCENKRMMEIFQSCNNRPIVFLRFNPDGKEKMFSFNKDGIIRTTKHFNKKYNELKERINFYLTNKLIKEITIEYLFYKEVN